jgi:hypothetical protein
MLMTFFLARDFVMVAVAALLAYFVLKLEAEKCTCSNDWRRDYIKSYTLISIGYILLSFGLPIIRTNIFVSFIFLAASAVNIYCVYTYMRILQESNCVCAVKEHSNIHEFFMFQSLISVILAFIFVIILLSIIVTSLFGGLLTKSGYNKLGNIDVPNMKF